MSETNNETLREWNAYITYLHEWASTHSQVEYKGDSPVDFDEFMEADYIGDEVYDYGDKNNSVLCSITWTRRDIRSAMTEILGHVPHESWVDRCAKEHMELAELYSSCVHTGQAVIEAWARKCVDSERQRKSVSVDGVTMWRDDDGNKVIVKCKLDSDPDKVWIATQPSCNNVAYNCVVLLPTDFAVMNSVQHTVVVHNCFWLEYMLSTDEFTDAQHGEVVKAVCRIAQALKEADDAK